MRDRFDFKGRFVDYMKEIPIYLIELKEPDLGAVYWVG